MSDFQFKALMDTIQLLGYFGVLAFILWLGIRNIK